MRELGASEEERFRLMEVWARRSPNTSNLEIKKWQ
jgi:hypothetical protein